MLEFVVGCPVYDRAWIMPRWFAHVEAACADLGVVPHYLFVGDPKDKATQTIIADSVTALNRTCHAIWVEEEPHEYRRDWRAERYEHMIMLRNKLLEGVRAISPDYFLSLDSDILLHKEAITYLVNAQTQYDFHAVGGKCFLTPIGTGTWAPSWANLSPEQTLLREDRQTILVCDCIMAIKLMTPKAYEVDYAFHQQGEDIGWSVAAREAGCYLGFDGRIANKHIMSPEHLDVYDDRVGF